MKQLAAKTDGAALAHVAERHRAAAHVWRTSLATARSFEGVFSSILGVPSFISPTCAHHTGVAWAAHDRDDCSITIYNGPEQLATAGALARRGTAAASTRCRAAS